MRVVDRNPPTSSAGESQTHEDLASGLCSAIEAASEGDSLGAAELFTNEVHGPLHGFAAEVTTTNRAIAADVLVGKNAVESDIDSEAGHAELERDLRTLLHSVRAGFQSLDREIATCRSDR